MKRIIVVAIDFSKGSINALEYALMIATKTASNILMVWVGKPETAESVYANPIVDPRLEVKKRFEELIQEYQGKFNGKIMYKIRAGKVYKEIVNQAKYHDAFMIIAGTHGVSGFEEFWIGSNAYRIVSYSPCPVITVQYNADTSKPIQKIVLPIDNTRETMQKVPFVCVLANAFKAEVHVLTLYSSSLKSLKAIADGYTKQVTKHLKDHKVSFIQLAIEAENITNATIDYAKSIQADLIAIMTEQETSLANILLGPYAEQMVNHSPIPVLSIHPTEFYDVLSKPV